MIITKNIKNIILAIISLSVILFLQLAILTAPIYSQSIDSMYRDIQNCRDSGGTWNQDARRCDKSKNSTGPTSNTTPNYKENDCEGDIKAGNGSCGILDYLVLFINVLAGLAGVVIVGSLIYAGILYSAAGSDAQRVAAAKDRIRNAIIALLFFIFGYGIINYLVPGGLL